MKQKRKVFAGAAVTMLLAGLLAACGGDSSGASSLPDEPLSIADGAPEAYTSAYLEEHPQLLVQPEHLIVARLDAAHGRSDVAVRLFMRQATPVSVDSEENAAGLADVTVVDARGVAVLTHRHGSGNADAVLDPGNYQVVFRAAPSAPGTIAKAHLIYLKLAETPTQARARLTPVASSGLARALSTKKAAKPAGSLGVASGNVCLACSFDGANLSNHDFSNQNIEQSTFRNANINYANFAAANCKYCVFTGIRSNGEDRGGFDGAALDNTTFQGTFASTRFRGASLSNAVFTGQFLGCDFGPSPEGVPTNFVGADLSKAGFTILDQNSSFRYADFTGANMGTTTFTRWGLAPSQGSVLVGAKFVDIKPSNALASFNFYSMDLSGVDFTGMDLSHVNLSTANAVIISPTTNVGAAILTDGQTGTNLSGQNFGSTYTKFAGTFDGTTPGTDLRGVNLAGAGLYQANLTGVNLSGAVLVGADLSNASLYRAKLIGTQAGVTPDSGSAGAANFSGAYMALADLTDADLRSVKFDNAHLYGAIKFVRARLDSASMIGANLAGADFTQASLANTNFTQAVLVGATFSGAALQNASMYRTYVQGASFSGTVSVSGLSLVDAYVSTVAGSWPFQETDGTPFVIAYNATDVGDLATTAKGVAVCPNGEQGPCSTAAKLLPSPAVPYPPPPPDCIPAPPDYDNCLPPG